VPYKKGFKRRVVVKAVGHFGVARPAWSSSGPVPEGPQSGREGKSEPSGVRIGARHHRKGATWRPHRCKAP
jgi:hypothetical protein